MAADERVRRAVVPEWRLRRALEFGDDALRELLPQLDAPLVERVDVPDHALREDAVLVERDQRPERLGRALGAHFVGRLPEGERLGLGEDVRERLRVEEVAVPDGEETEEDGEIP